MQFKQRSLDQLADMICGNFDHETSYFVYRSSSYITKFFQDADTDYQHDGSTRAHWVGNTLKDILAGPQPAPNAPPEAFSRVIQTLMDPSDARHEDANRTQALAHLNITLAREGYEAFYAEDKKCYLRHIATKTVATAGASPHRPFS